MLVMVARRVVLCHDRANFAEHVGGLIGLSLLGEALGPIPPPGGPTLVKVCPRWRVESFCFMTVRILLNMWGIYWIAAFE